MKFLRRGTVLLHDFRVGSWLVQPTLNRISQGEVTKHLEPKVMQVLLYLAETPARVVPKDEILSQVWPEIFVSDDVLLRCISELRKALEDDVRQPRYIQTIPKSGYRLVAAVSEETTPEGPADVTRSSVWRQRPGRWLLAATLVSLLGSAAVVGIRHYRPPIQEAPRPTVLAVLPFVDLSGESDQAFFGDGVTEEMITELGRVDPSRLRVIARTSAMHYKDSRKRIDQIGKELGADFILEGTVRVEDQRTRISARLVRTTDQANLWTASYDREISSILALQTEVAREVAGRISLALTDSEETAVESASVNTDAYMSYFKGRYHYHKFTTEGFVTATQHFRKAVELAPGHARSWLGLSDTYRLRGSWWGDLPPKEAFPIAKEAVARALSLDPDLAEAHASLGWIRFVFDWDWSGAEAEFQRAIELSPNSRDAHSPYANYLRCMGRPAEARVEIEQCLEIDPLSPLELAEAGLVYIALDDLQKSDRFVRQAIEVSPDFPAALYSQAMLCQRRGDLDRSAEILEKAVSVSGPVKMFLGHLGLVYVRTGKTEQAQRIVEQLLKTPSVSAGYLCGLYRQMGEDEKALDWLERAYEERDPLMVWMYSATASHPLWNNPRYQRIRGLMNFPSIPPGS